MDDLLNIDACTLPTRERPLRLAEFDELFADSVRSVTWAADRVVMHLEGDPQLPGRVRSLVDRETACCSFFTFAVEDSGSDLVLDVTVPPERRELLRALADRAVRSSS